MVAAQNRYLHCILFLVLKIWGKFSDSLGNLSFFWGIFLFFEDDFYGFWGHFLRPFLIYA
jgi:hypothetical protein